MDLKEFLSSRGARIDEYLQSYLPAVDYLPERLHEAMRYSVFAGGKRVRPILMMASCQAVGGNEEHVLPFACAMEMIHTYSLIHDDLPAMDNDDFRRGRPTNHRVFGEAMAILAGDALLTEAFALLSNPHIEANLDAATRLRVIHLVSKAAGSRGMVGGQVVDMESEGKEFDQPTLEYIHTHKTGALILASIQTGALVGQATEQQFANLSRYGEAAGLAFQIADDILDIVGDQDTIGKDVGSDEERGKATYPALFGLDGARQRAKELKDIALSALEPFGSQADPLRLIADFFVDRSF